MKICPNCNAQLEDDAVFCTECGQGLASSACAGSPTPLCCEQCGATLRPGVKFCPSCGNVVATSSHVPQTAAGNGGAMSAPQSNMGIRPIPQPNPTSLNTNPAGQYGIPQSVYGNSSNLNLNFSVLDPYYQNEFQKIYESGETYKGHFNIYAFMGCSIWALVKGATTSGIVTLVLSVPTAIFTFGLSLLLLPLLYGFRGTYIYYNAYVKNSQIVF
ncbi:MAG: zinc-ribbon domain-containing protein [Schwartzia succinivorans]|nr:zinc-ribbon domain-containing protein [Schwartzia succinivorans]